MFLNGRKADYRRSERRCHLWTKHKNTPHSDQRETAWDDPPLPTSNRSAHPLSDENSSERILKKPRGTALWLHSTVYCNFFFRSWPRNDWFIALFCARLKTVENQPRWHFVTFWTFYVFRVIDLKQCVRVRILCKSFHVERFEERELLVCHIRGNPKRVFGEYQRSIRAEASTNRFQISSLDYLEGMNPLVNLELLNKGFFQWDFFFFLKLFSEVRLKIKLNYFCLVS